MRRKEKKLETNSWVNLPRSFLLYKDFPATLLTKNANIGADGECIKGPVGKQLPVCSFLYSYLRGSYGRKPTHKDWKDFSQILGSKAPLGIPSFTTWYLFSKLPEKRTVKKINSQRIQFTYLDTILFHPWNHHVFWYNTKKRKKIRNILGAEAHFFHVWLNFREEVKGQAWVAV